MLSSTVDVAAASDNDNDSDDDDSNKDGLLFLSLRAHRALINVWIPSVFLQGRAANAYHVYQVDRGHRSDINATVYCP